MTIKILDCTLRDGGYYNNWDFAPEVVDAYLSAMAEANIDFVELGLRNFPKNGFDGPFAYTTESFINRLHLPEGPIYGVMVDAKTIISSSLGVQQAIKSLFVESNQSKINLVRIAAHFHEVGHCGEIVSALTNMGYQVGFNLMQAVGKSNELLAEKALIASSWTGLGSLYFADSLGNMDSNELKRIVKALKIHWTGELGIHTHNNMGKGLDNTLTAYEQGVTWLDVTVTGMGRGAGNTQTESLLASLSNEFSAYNPSPIYDLVIRHFESMQRECGWGSNLLYFLGAQNNVHPTYIQNLLSDSHYGTEEIIGAIEYLSKIEGASSYKGDVFDNAINSRTSSTPVSGSGQLKGCFDEREVLIVASGPNLEKYLSEIKAYIQERKPIVLAINAINSLDGELIDYYCISHNSKFLSQNSSYKEFGKVFILPKHRFSEREINEFEGVNVIDFGLVVNDGQLSAQETFATIPYDLTAAYALCIAQNAGAKEISLVGFDGYEKGDKRQEEMVDVFTLFNSKVTVTSLTPSTYPVKQGSIYAPNI